MSMQYSNPLRFFGLIVVIWFAFSFNLLSQQKFTILMYDGSSRQYSLEGLKLTFNNFGVFSIWQNETKQEMGFAAIDKVTFTDQVVNIRKNNFAPSISLYVDQSGMLHIKGELIWETEVCIFSLQGIVLYKKEQSISAPIDISSLRPGVYVLKAGNKNIKFLKP